MEEGEMIVYLNDPSYNKRDEVLDHMRKSIRSSGKRISPFHDPVSIFHGLALALKDVTWETRYQCIKLIDELVPCLGSDLDQCMQLVLPQIVSLLAYSKVTLSNAAGHALNTYANYTSQFQLVLHSIIRHGINSRDTTTKKAVIKSISFLLTDDHRERDLTVLIESLIMQLDNSTPDDEMQDSIHFSLSKIADLVGQERFKHYLNSLSESLRHRYYCLVGGEAEGNGDINHFNSGIRNDTYHLFHPSTPKSANSRGRISTSESNVRMKFGIISEHIVLRLSEDISGSDQIKAVEDMKRVVKDSSHLKALIPYLSEYFDFLKKLTDDKPTITSKILEIVEILVERLGIWIEDHLRQLSSFLAKQMPDNNLTVHTLIMRIALRLLQILPPRTVLPALLENLSHKNFHVRQKTLNIIIASLLTHPSNDFDLGKLCQAIVRTLIDQKRQVRQASLECFAMIAQAMGTGKQQQLIAAVDSLEQNADADGVMAAVQARLARRQLPTLVDYMVEYATQVPLNSSRGGSSAVHMVDIDWIVSGSNSSFSGRSGPFEAFNPYRIGGPYSASKILTRGSSEDLPQHQNKQNEWALKSEPVSKASDGGRPLRHHNSAQFPLRGSDPSPDLSGNGSVSALDIRDWESLDPYSSPGAVHNSSSTRVVMSLTWPSDQMVPESNTEPSPPSESLFLNLISGRSESESRPFHTKPMPVRTPSSTKKASAAAAAAAAAVSTVPSESRNSENSRSRTEEKMRRGEEDLPESQEEMNNSLRGIRHSASKKQLNKLFEKQESRDSLRATQQNTEAEKEFSAKDGKGPTSDVPENFLSSVKPEAPAYRKKITSQMNSTYHPDNINNSASDFSFQDNWSSNVGVVGKGYSAEDDLIQLPAFQRSSPAFLSKKNKERRKPPKVMPLSPYDSPGIPVYGSLSHDGLRAPAGIVGKAAFSVSAANEIPASSPSFPADIGQQNTFSMADERPLRGGRLAKVSASLPSAVYGSAVKNELNSPTSYESEYLSSDGSSAYEKNERLRNKAPAEGEKRSKAHQLRRINSNDRRQYRRDAYEDEDGEDTEAGTFEEDNKRTGYSSRVNSSSTADTGFEDGQGDEVGTYQPKRRQKRKKQLSNEVETMKASDFAKDDSIENSAPLGNPSIALNQALQYLAQENWEEKMQGLSLVRRLALHHQDVLVPELSRVLTAVGAEVKNLRSRVSCEAMVCLSDLFSHLKKGMDLDLDRTVSVLLSKTGDQSNQFTREEAQKVLAAMVDNVTAQKAIAALTALGPSSRSAHIRTVTAHMLERIVERLGPEKVFSGSRDLADKILPISAQFLLDASPDVRYFGQRIFHMLMFHQDFDRIIKKTISESLLRNVQDKLDAVRLKGPTESSIGSSRLRRIPVADGKGSNRGGSAPVNSDSSLPPVNTSSFTSASAGRKKTQPPRVDDSTFAEIQSMESNLSSSDWRQRCNGVEQLQQLVDENPAALSSCLTKVFSKYVPCLHDSNSKLNLYALQVLNAITPSIARSLASSSILNLTVQTIISNLASKNQEIFTTAMAILESFESHIDPALLLAPFISEAQKGKAIIKSEMTTRISGILLKIDSRRINQVLAQTLPFVWHLLSLMISNSGGSRLRGSFVQLLGSLRQLMGESGLVSAARTSSNVTLPMQELLTELLQEAM